MNVRAVALIVMTTAAILPLSGCATAPAYSDLDREATPADVWPSGLPSYSGESADIGTSRLVGHYGSTELYLARATDPADGACLLVYETDTVWVSSCGTSGFAVGGGGLGSYIVFPDGADIGDREAISENVFSK